MSNLSNVLLKKVSEYCIPVLCDGCNNKVGRFWML